MPPSSSGSIDGAIAAWSKDSSQAPANAAARRYYAKAGVAQGKLREAAEAEKLAWTVDPRPETVLALAQLATSTHASTGAAVGVDDGALAALAKAWP